MMKVSKIVLLLVLVSTTYSAWADRGIGRKTKAKTFSLNLNTNVSLRSSISINLKSGLVYKGSTLGTINTVKGPVVQGTVSYQKGNNVYVLPYKQKIVTPEVKQGYAGMKLIIRSN